MGQQLTRRVGVDGVLIHSVNPNSPASRAGLKGTMLQRGVYILGDVIQGIDGQPVHTEEDIYRILERHSAGDVVKLTIFRNGEQIEVPIELVKERQ